MMDKLETSGENGFINLKERKAVYKDRFILLNGLLIEKQNITDDEISQLLHSHVELMRLKDYAENLSPKTQKDELKENYKEIVKVFEKQQKLWHFDVNPEFHEFWTVPHCSCPKQDNREEWTTLISCYHLGKKYTPFYVKIKSCPVHGD